MSPTRVASAASLPAALATLFLLVGCSPAPHPADPETPAPPADSAPAAPAIADPVFADDAAALAAAEAAMQAYTDVSYSVINGELDPSELERVSSGRELTETREFLDRLERDHQRLLGHARTTDVRLIRVDDLPERTSIEIYFCVDVSETRLVDADTENDITPPDRRARTPYTGTLSGGDSADGTLRLESTDPWPGTDFCS